MVIGNSQLQHVLFLPDLEAMKAMKNRWPSSRCSSSSKCLISCVPALRLLSLRAGDDSYSYMSVSISHVITEPGIIWSFPGVKK